MSRTSHEDPWTTRGMLRHLFPKRQRISPAMSRQALLRSLHQRQLTEMAMARFEWRGLPESVNPLWLEHLLISQGQALVARDPGNGHIIPLSATPVGAGNYQNDHQVVRGNAATWGSYAFLTMRNYRLVKGEPQVDEPNSVHLFNNATRSSDLALIDVYAERLAELDTTIDINSMNMRRNKVVVADENTKLAAENMLAQIAEGEPVVRVRSLDIENIVKTLDLSVDPDSVDRLHIFRGRMFNEAMMALGIDNTNQDKKERMVTDEIGGNDDQVARIRASMLNQRRLAALKMTEVFKLSKPVTVDYAVQDDPGNDPVLEPSQLDGPDTAPKMLEA